jgi:hypothetical protein
MPERLPAADAALDAQAPLPERRERAEEERQEQPRDRPENEPASGRVAALALEGRAQPVFPPAAERAAGAPGGFVAAPPLQELARQHLQGLSIQRLNGQTSLKLELSARGLSRVGLRLQIEAGVLSARLHVADPGTRDALRGAAGELEAALLRTSARGVAVDIDLEHEDGTGKRRGQDSRHQHGERERSESDAGAPVRRTSKRSSRALVL